MTLTQKETRAAAAAATAKYFLKSNHEIVANSEEVKEYEETLDSQKCEREIVEWISRPRKPPSSNEYNEAEGEEEDVGATQYSADDNSQVDEYGEGCEYNQEDNRKDIVLYNIKNIEEEA